MQPAKESRQHCRVARQFDAVAHLVEQPYASEHTFWFGSVEIALDPGRWEELAWQDVALEFADGRVGEAYIPHTGTREVAGVKSLVLYYVGVTTLTAVPDSRGGNG
jgi:hypothetical protein